MPDLSKLAVAATESTSTSSAAAAAKWTPQLQHGYTSAYRATSDDDAEPAFTNWAKIKDDEPFIETLDYIFLSPRVKALTTLALPAQSELDGPLPNGVEPSDHLLIAADIEYA
jgi:hypothetical protein